MASSKLGPLDQANQYANAGEKQLRTSLARWKPNYDGAADNFSQAAQYFRKANEISQSVSYSQKAASNYEKNKSFFHAGKALENSIVYGKDIVQPDEIYSTAMKSAELYQQHGSGDSAACVLAKAANILRNKHPELAFKLYQQAADTSYAESAAHSALEYTSLASRLLVKLDMLDAAMDSVKLEIAYHLKAGNTAAAGRMVVVGVLIQLGRCDNVAAQKVYKEWGMNCELPERQNLEMLLKAADEGDAETMVLALADPFIRNMDVEYSCLARRINLPQDVKALDLARAANDAEGETDIVESVNFAGLC